MIERKMLSLETTALLDKLYNLRGEDSVILVEMDKVRDTALETKKRTTDEKKELETKIADLDKDLANISSEGEKLSALLSSINRDEYSTVLDRLNIDFEPTSLKNKIDELLPETVKNCETDIASAQDKLKEVEEEMTNAETTIEEVSIRRDAAISNQNRLNEYFNLALKGNINITRDQITDLLKNLNLSDEEAREGAKLLMFPEDALFEYDRRYSEGQTGKSISEVFKEANLNTEEVKEEEPVVEETITEIEPEVEEKEDIVDNGFSIVDIDDSILEPEEITIEPINIEDAPVIEEEPVIEEIPTVEIPVKESTVEESTSFEEEFEKTMDLELNNTEEEIDPKQAVINTLSSNNIDYLDITDDDMNKLVDNFDEEVINSNITTIRNQGIDTDMLIDNISLFYDSELKDKINLLISVGKEALDIYFNSKVLVKYDYQGLQDAINLLKENGLDPKKVPLMAY